MNDFPTFRNFGEHAILIDWPASIDLVTHVKVLNCCVLIRKSFTEEILDIVQTYHSLVVYVVKTTYMQEFLQKLKVVILSFSEEQTKCPNVISIPVCYEEPFAIDLAAVAKTNRLSIPEVIQLHTTPLYKVYFLGFLPGFPYLGGLDARLHIERRIEPRPRVEKGSVGIGGRQTGIYPNDSPGGWNIIGRTPLQLFDASSQQPTEINAGDFIKFEPITKIEFDLLQIETESGIFQWRKEVYHD
ncbi:MAG: 5-oxoprolinase subunit PxpB [Flavobacteriaceae bacterium]|nr:5-oxoprolinase subunit PxpB [Flavobacteriaceae bacterium]